MARSSSTSLVLRCAALAACFVLVLHAVHAEPEAATAEKPAAAQEASPPPPPPPAAAHPPPPPAATSKPKPSAPKQDKPIKKAAAGSGTSVISKAKHDVDHFLHSTEAHTAKSALVLSDVALVMAGIQLQLSIVHENYLSLKAGGEAVAKTHAHMAHVHHEREHLCAQGSMGILSILLLENLAAMWAQGPKKFFKKTAQGVDFFIVSTSLYLEIIFETLTGSQRVIAEWWRFVRIVHGAYETFFHSPIVAPLFNPSFGHGHH